MSNSRLTRQAKGSITVSVVSNFQNGKYLLEYKDVENSLHKF